MGNCKSRTIASKTFGASRDHERSSGELTDPIDREASQDDCKTLSISERRPLFELERAAISEKTRIELMNFAIDDGLGDDPSSKHFMTRKKSMAYVMVIHDQVYSLQTDYFIQSDSYNDFSGGYKRSYRLLPEKLVQKTLSKFVIDFAKRFDIPNYAIILMQLQSSIREISASRDDEKQETSADVTGQGIHTDGSDFAVLLCVERSNVDGAYNSLYADLRGEETLLPPTVLNEGDALYFEDKSLYHYVSDAKPIDAEKDLRRTVLIMHYPGHHSLTGRKNPSNGLNCSDSKIKLRNEVDDDDDAPRVKTTDFNPFDPIIVNTSSETLL
mmetsp:Transcript_20355/g.56627  ORF Transcript_20355/g.56627 Transcript_20355/m.56627 type:complete len:328 (+) Transcript_20355:432-1415(+)|eukprot:CAMPEP_0172363484 /NCGR_PEP_ID=MMETSP1060-20121228/6837_1 /TAXON_ID=37318 /ORGANISM="Pseudo-nitzschia pungens, Strain cf. cingulata" /LENGTH=327 /DNA_ID=CAMNT_0013086235 /DNA_START=376 /DNA_END=1359 /DNA_ORIENTATION=+